MTDERYTWESTHCPHCGVNMEDLKKHPEQSSIGHLTGKCKPAPTHDMTVHYEVLGGHTHIAIFTGPHQRQRGKAGDLTMTNAEFEAWKSGRLHIEFIDRKEIPF